jgi:hypothetical protein
MPGFAGLVFNAYPFSLSATMAKDFSRPIACFKFTGSILKNLRLSEISQYLSGLPG